MLHKDTIELYYFQLKLVDIQWYLGTYDSTMVVITFFVFVFGSNLNSFFFYMFRIIKHVIFIYEQKGVHF